MFGLGIPELALILIIALLMFGTGKLTDSARALGQSIRGYREETAKYDASKEKNITPPKDDSPKES